MEDGLAKNIRSIFWLKPNRKRDESYEISINHRHHGQDGSYLAELLLEKGYRVHGVVRRSSSFSTGRIDHLYRDVHEKPQLLLHYGDLTDGQALNKSGLEIQPDEIYNLGARATYV